MTMTRNQTSQTDHAPPAGASQNYGQIVYSQGSFREENGEVIVEALVTLTVNGSHWLSLLCTPISLEALGVGFLYNEGIIADLSEVASVRICPQGDNVDVWLTHSVEKPERWTRTSGCSGGITREHRSAESQPAFTNGGMVSPGQINQMLAEFYTLQTLYRQTGGVHTSALSDGEKIILVAEDIGRHNTLDKLAGRCLLDGLTATRRILLTTGRISSEMLQKASRIKAPIVISRTSPSSRSIEMADGLGITLLGYARKDAFIIFTHPERIVVDIET